MLRMQLFQSMVGDVGVDLRRCQTAVPQQHLHDAKIRAVIEQMRGKDMTQGMRRNGLTHTRLKRVLLDPMSERLACHHLRPWCCEKHLPARAHQESGNPSWPERLMMHPPQNAKIPPTQKHRRDFLTTSYT
jgi:lambda repressor-like predicted transcriptional regulator